MFAQETQALMEAAVDAIIVIDHQGRIMAMNDATRRLFGYASDDLLGKSVNLLMPASQGSRHDDYLRDYLAGGEARIIGVGREVTARRRDGSEFPAHLSVGRIAGTPPRFIGILRDITVEHEAKRALEQALLTQERLTRVAQLATMGEMAAGVAHELNQPLAAITTYANACDLHLGREQPDYDEVREAVREIGAEGLRAGEIIRRLRQLVRGDASVRRATDINALVDDLRALMRADARVHGARLDIDTGVELPPVYADPVQLQQVVLNLVRNALEAVVDSPAAARVVEIRTRRAADGDVELLVSDNGPGIAPEVTTRLFEPFYTSKPNGTGLGLAMSRTIVQSHKGSIHTQPAEPHGAVFVVRLPAMERKAA